MSAVAWRDVRLAAGTATILDGVSLGARQGEVLGIVGPNGAGKTALLRCAAGLVAGFAGQIEIGGASVRTLSAAVRARRLAFLPQAAEPAWPVVVADAVALGRLPHRDAGTAGDDAAVAAALDAVGIAPLAARRIDTLSGGERALALLARALAVEAPILLLDEPCAALDARHQLAVMALLRRRAGDGACVVAVLHDLGLAARFCDRVAVLARGRVAACDAPGAALDDVVLAAAYGVRAVRMRVDGQMLLAPWAPVETGAGAQRP
jgi:iron complex transport system ATP-binding protein